MKRLRPKSPAPTWPAPDAPALRIENGYGAPLCCSADAAHGLNSNPKESRTHPATPFRWSPKPASSVGESHRRLSCQPSRVCFSRCVSRPGTCADVSERARPSATTAAMLLYATVLILRCDSRLRCWRVRTTSAGMGTVASIHSQDSDTVRSCPRP